jgi:hypothetical protein
MEELQDDLDLVLVKSGGRSVGIVRSRTKSHGVCFFVLVKSIISLQGSQAKLARPSNP